MRLAFYRGGNSLIERIIRKRTNGEYCHVELLFSDENMFSSDLSDGGTRFVRHSLPVDSWTIVDIGPSDEVALRAFCESQNGLKYDLLGCVDFLFAVPEHASNRWFCSGVCTAALQTQNIFSFLKPTNTSPEELFIAAMARNEIGKNHWTLN